MCKVSPENHCRFGMNLIFLHWAHLRSYYQCFIFVFLQIENSFSLSVPIFKQFHKNIIGKGGANIKKVMFVCILSHCKHQRLNHFKYANVCCQIREETNTKIDLPTENSNSEMIVITGKKSNCEAARDRILAIQRELVRGMLFLSYTGHYDE